MEAQKGDGITVESNKGRRWDPDRGGRRGHPGQRRRPDRVRWDDGRKTTFFSSSEAHPARGN